MVYLSIASLWEIAIKKSLGKLEIKQTIVELAQICHDSDITIPSIKTGYLDNLETLPKIHGDPFSFLCSIAGYRFCSAIASYLLTIL